MCIKVKMCGPVGVTGAKLCLQHAREHSVIPGSAECTIVASNPGCNIEGYVLQKLKNVKRMVAKRKVKEEGADFYSKLTKTECSRT